METPQYTPKGRIKKVFQKPYSPERMANIKRLIENFQRQGTTKRYAILIDGEVCIPHGSSIDVFDDYLDFLHPESETVEVRLFHGESPNYKLHVFSLHETPQNYGLGGYDAPRTYEEIVAHAVEKQKLEFELESTKDKLKRKNKKLRKYKEMGEKPGFDLGGLFSKGLEIISGFNGAKKEVAQSGVSGLDENQAEIVSEESSSLDKLFAKLKKNISQKDLEFSLRLCEFIIQHPELQPQFKEIINSTKNKQ